MVANAVALQTRTALPLLLGLPNGYQIKQRVSYQHSTIHSGFETQMLRKTTGLE